MMLCVHNSYLSDRAAIRLSFADLYFFPFSQKRYTFLIKFGKEIQCFVFLVLIWV